MDRRNQSRRLIIVDSGGPPAVYVRLTVGRLLKATSATKSPSMLARQQIPEDEFERSLTTNVTDVSGERRRTAAR